MTILRDNVSVYEDNDGKLSQSLSYPILKICDDIAIDGASLNLNGNDSWNCLEGSAKLQLNEEFHPEGPRVPPREILELATVRFF